jgi:hypothetical protein
MSEHAGRKSATLSWAISVGESLRSQFDDYVAKELHDIKEQIDLLETVGEEMSKERERLQAVEKELEEANGKLTEMLDSAKKGEITNIGQCLAPLFAGFTVLDSVDKLKYDVDRWSRSLVRSTDSIMEAVEEVTGRRL